MRTMRTSLVGTVTFALLGGLGSVALAQGDMDTGPMTHFTGTRLSAVEDTTDEEWWEEDGILHFRGYRATETVEWSDPRLPSEFQIVQNLVASRSSAVVSGTTLLEGPEGYWTGEFTAYCDADSDCFGMNTITGHEAYEGLLAVLRGFYAEGPEVGDWVYEGLIFEGEIPPMPEALEPPAPATAATDEVTAESDESGDAADESLDAIQPSRASLPSGGCGTASATAGTSQDSMEVADLTRSWYTHVPPAHDGRTPLPLVIQLHGNGSDATFMAGFTGLAALGDEEGFVTVTPEGRGQVQRWVYEFDARGWDVTPTNPDVLFIGALIDRLGQQLCLDLARVYVTGISNGGQAATAFACVLDERIAAIAPVAGVVDSGDDCNTARPVPMLVFHGQEDPIALFDGGIPAFVAESPSEVGTPLGDLPMAWVFEGPVTERVAGIAERYGCAAEPSTEFVAEHVELVRHACPDGADVVLVIATDGGHAWPGAPFPPEMQGLGHVNMEIDASRMMWDFFAGHALTEE